MSPQITCPNCGMTVNLENRKKTDYHLIKSTVKNGPKTFTELLHASKLSRKTLSLRLKELCAIGVLVKKAGMYELNGNSIFSSDSIDPMTRISKRLNPRARTGLMLLMFLVFSSGFGFVLATFLNSPISNKLHEEPALIGTFTMDLYVYNVNDLYAWQVAITYDSTIIKVLKVLPGGFVGEDFPWLVNSTDSFKDLLLLGGFLKGDVQGKSGSGKLARIIFGYTQENYSEPKIVPEKVFKTMLLNSQRELIPINDYTRLELIPA